LSYNFRHIDSENCLPPGVDLLLKGDSSLADCQILGLIPALARILGYYTDEVSGGKLSDLLVFDKNKERLLKISKKIKEQGGFSDFLFCRHRVGIPLKIGLLFIENQATSNYRVKLLEIVRHHHRWSLEQYVEQYDFITGLADRELIFKYLVEQMEQSQKKEIDFHVARIELNNHKSFSEEYDIKIYEKIMRKMAARLLGCLPGRTIAGRITPDSFILFLFGYKSTSRLETLFRDIFRRLLEPVYGDEFIYTPDVNAGVAAFSPDFEQPSEFLGKVDLALRWAKNEPDNNYRFYFKKMDDREYWYK